MLYHYRFTNKFLEAQHIVISYNRKSGRGQTFIPLLAKGWCVLFQRSFFMTD